MTTKHTNRVKTGAILEIELKVGFAYAQFVGKHSEYGDVIYVFTKMFTKSISNVEDLTQIDGYIAFYSAKRSVQANLSKVVGVLPLQNNACVPSRLRRAGARGTAGMIHTWIIEENGAEFVTDKLTPDQLRLPIASIWDHELLKIRMSEGWTPERVGTS